ncbi:hypothetical protein [Rhizobium sp. BK456]|uniref:hypothetical protein n=1 Tax=Rhizobium sp. BK456 TaxID=2587007 RepID=UPI001611F940|nr:hypothetical protein [Rhizobium sp. BK456]MBB3521037.1 hypothetical protein [Rhizobium sp. BK456]
MPDIADDNWSERDDQNAEVAPYGWPPGVPAAIELIGRMMMGAIKRSWRRFNPFYPTTGSADAYIVTPSSNPQFINIYEIIRVRIDRANTTTAPTLKYGGANARTIKRITPAGKVAVVVGDLVAGKDHSFWYDGTDFILMDPATISGTLVTGALLAANNLSDVLSASTSLSNIGGAPLNSPTFTGIVTIPTGALISGYALLASPAFTGNPTAPTQSAGNNSTRLATTAYADGAVATSAALKVDKTTTVSGGGLATGGGALSSNQVITVTKASTAQAAAGTDDATVLTPLKLRDALNATGSAPVYACRAWVRFTGATGAILGSGNVTSVTRNGAGDYTINFTTAMPDANYVTRCGAEGTTAANVDTINVNATGGQATGSVRIIAVRSGTGAFDPTAVGVEVFR